MSKRRTDEEVGETLQRYEYIKIGMYINAREPVQCQDADGYIVYPVLYRLYDGKRPMRFHVSNPSTIENIKHYININHINVKLLSTIFTGTTDKLKFLCECGDEYETTLDNFIYKHKYCCNKCAFVGMNSLSFKTLVGALSKNNLYPLFSEDEYFGITSTHLPVANLDGYKAPLAEQYCRIDAQPAWFHISNPYTIDNINIYLSATMNDEYVCISKEYVGNKEPLKILHKKCGTVFEAKWINLYRKPSKIEPNRHGTQCPYCMGLRLQSLHALVLKQLFERLKDGTVVEDQSCRNPNTGCILPTDIVNHKEKIAIEVQSWFHDKEKQKIKDEIKRKYWEDRGCKVYTPDIRNYTVLQMAQIFFPDLNEIPSWVKYDFELKLDVISAQKLLDDGLTVTAVALELGVPTHRIYDAIYNKRLQYPDNYINKNLIKHKHIS